MGITLDLWIEESGRMAREAERRYNRFMKDHPYIEKTGEFTKSVIHPNKSAKEEFESLLEPGIEGFENLGNALDSSYEENTLDNREEDQYYDR